MHLLAVLPDGEVNIKQLRNFLIAFSLNMIILSWIPAERDFNAQLILLQNETLMQQLFVMILNMVNVSGLQSV